MTKILKQMIDKSYKNGELDPKTVSKIADYLNRKELKQYIKGLKNRERQKTVIIEMPSAKIDKYQEKFRNIFPDKRIIWKENSLLILGAKITDNDEVFEMNLKNILENMLSYIEQ